MGAFSDGVKACNVSVVRLLLVSSTNASTLRCVEIQFGWTSFSPGVFCSIVRVMRLLMLLQFGGEHPVPWPVPWSSSP